MLKKLVLLMSLTTLGCAASPESVYRHSKDKVVKIGMILVDGDKKYQGLCSGAFIDANWRVLTCAHCVADKGITKLFVKTEDGQVYTGVIEKIDMKRDLAIIEAVWPDDSIPFVIADNPRVYHTQNSPYFDLGKEARQGEEVFAFGSPLDLTHSMSTGYVENVVDKGSWYIVHSAAILPGSSGGPLVDKHGRLIGVNEAMLMLNPFNVAPGYYIAIDLKEIKDFLEGK